MEAIVSRSTDQEWGRREEEIEDIGKVWMFAPKEESAVKYGVVCLLSESQTPPDLVVKLWKDTCQKHNLIIAIPVNSEDTALTREDRSLIPAALGVVAKKFQIDTRRVILAAEKPEALLCSELLLEPRLRQFRAAVFLDCWPQISGLPPQILTAKSPSVLLVDGAIQSRQATALRDQARAALKEAGVWTISVPAEQPDQAAIEDRIAAWALNLKAK